MGGARETYRMRLVSGVAGDTSTWRGGAGMVCRTWRPLGSPPPAGRGWLHTACAHPEQGLAGSISASHWQVPLDGRGRGPVDGSPPPSAFWPLSRVDSKSGGAQRDAILKMEEILEHPFVLAQLLSGV